VQKLLQAPRFQEAMERGELVRTSVSDLQAELFQRKRLPVSLACHQAAVFFRFSPQSWGGRKSRRRGPRKRKPSWLAKGGQ
jgi:hypothetical protein